MPEAVPVVLLIAVFLAGGWLAASVAVRIGRAIPALRRDRREPRPTETRVRS